MKALIDVDPLCYSIGSFTNPHPFLKDAEGVPFEMPYSTEVIHGFVDETIADITEAAQATDATLYLSTAVSTNFRDAIATAYPYKGSREGSSRPFHHSTVVEYIASLPNVQIANHREADDDLADACKADPSGTIICTIDKDLDGVPGWHYNWKHNERYHVSPEQALRFFFYQLLVGDWSTDCILGCGKLVQKVYGPKAAKAGQQYQRREGIGPKAAENMLLGASPSEYFDVVLTAYEQVWGSDAKAMMVEMANLLYMGGSEDNLLTLSKLKEMHND